MTGRGVVRHVRDVWIPVLAAVRAAFWLGLGAPVYGGFSRPALICMVVVFAGVGGYLVVGGRRDPRARWLGSIYLLIATTYTSWPAMGGVVSLGPTTTVLRSLQPQAFLPYFAWTLFSDFPRVRDFPAERARLALVRQGTFAVGAVLFVLSVFPLPDLLRTLPEWLAGPVQWVHIGSAARGFWTVVAAATLPSLLVAAMRTRRAGLGERRKVVLLVVALMIGGVPPLLMGAVSGLDRGVAALGSTPGGLGWVLLIEYGPLILMAGLSAYAVTAHRALDVRVIVRRTIQYALARSTVLALTALPLVALAVIAFRARDAPLEALFAGPQGWRLLMLTSLGAMLLLGRSRILLRLDRTFFRESFSARQILAEFMATVPGVGTPAGMAGLVADHIDRAMHVSPVVPLFADADRRSLADPSGGVRPLSLLSTLAERVGRSRSCMDVRLSRDETHALPTREREWVADAGFELVTPILDSAGALIGLIGLGEKRSELPFSNDDRDLLMAIAGSLGLALENQTLLTTTPSSSGDRDVSRTVDDEVPTVRALDSVRTCGGCDVLSPADDERCVGCGRELEEQRYPRVVRGKYALERVAGRGGMGVVFRARDLDLGRHVAIKTLPRFDPSRVEWLRREARTMAGFSHPNLAVVLAAETWHASPFLIFEYLPGGTLADRLRAGPLDVGRALELGMAIAGVAEVFHRGRILHRDIKPSNIGFSLDGTPKLLDFGIARLIPGDGHFESGSREAATSVPDGAPPVELGFELETEVETEVEDDVAGHEVEPARMLAPVAEALSRRSALLGTLPYLPPEALDGAEPSPPFDLWAINLVVYEALTGKNPMQARTHAGVVANIARAEVPDVRSFAPQADVGVADHFRRAFGKDPGVRPSTAAELGRDFRALAETVAK